MGTGLNAWAVAFGTAWGVAWGSGDVPPPPPPAASVASVPMAGDMGGVAGPLDQYVEPDLANEDEEAEIAHIAAFVIRNFA